MKTLNKFKERFVDTGRLFTELTSKKQRVFGKREGYFYVALYDRIQDKWALVMNPKASYPCYTLSQKGEPIAIYIDRMGNTRERIIKQEMFNEVLNNSESSQEFRENLRSSQQILKEKYSIEWLKPSLGYNLENLPYSCQKGKGQFFEWLDDLAKMLLLRNNKGEIVGRCLVWDKEHIKHNGQPLLNNIADRLYYNESKYKIALKSELKKLGIDCMWEQQGDGERPFEYREFTLHLPKDIKELLNTAIDKNECPFLDTFNHYNLYDGILYSWHWTDRLGHEYYEWGNTTHVLLGTSGYPTLEEDEVWDDYDGCYIDYENAVEPLNFDGTTHIYNCIYSQHHEGYLLEGVGDIIAVKIDNGYGDYDYTYLGSGVELIEINGETYFLDEVRRWRA